jgi:hypothetical protein
MRVPTRRQKLVIAVVVPMEVVSAVFAWRDLSQRGDGEIRGSKRFWRLFMAVNPGNSLLYWLLGRRS